MVHDIIKSIHRKVGTANFRKPLLENIVNHSTHKSVLKLPCEKKGEKNI